jgi:hypothetical protein
MERSHGITVCLSLAWESIGSFQQSFSRTHWRPNNTIDVRSPAIGDARRSARSGAIDSSGAESQRTWHRCQPGFGVLERSAVISPAPWGGVAGGPGSGRHLSRPILCRSGVQHQIPPDPCWPMLPSRAGAGRRYPLHRAKGTGDGPGPGYGPKRWAPISEDPDECTPSCLSHLVVRHVVFVMELET